MTTILPFPKETFKEPLTSFSEFPETYRDPPPLLKETCEANPPLLQYLRMLSTAGIEMPAFYAKLGKELGDLKKPNLIYPVTEKLFVHILVDENDSRNSYIPIEPSLPVDLTSLLNRVEQMCIEHADKLPLFDEEADREKHLMNYIDLVTMLESKDHQEEKAVKGKPASKNSGEHQFIKIPVTAHELDVVKYLFVRDKIGMGELEPLSRDTYIEDVSCAGLGPLFIEHKIFGSLKCSINFTSMEEVDNFVLRTAEKMQKPLSLSAPIIDATLANGSRINIVYGSEVSKRGSNFTIRRFSTVPLSIFELVDFGTLNYKMLAYLSLVVANGMNMFVAGESASGKTSLLNAITAFIHPHAKIITIEDTPELQVPHENWIREVVQTTRANDTSGAVTTFDLLRAALRQRPNEIMVGEIRGPEGNVAFQAMQTGHSVMTTFHAASVEKLIQRITSNPISVPKTYIDNLNVVIIMNAVKLPNGKIGRRIMNISEIVGYDSPSDSFNIVEAFHWEEDKDEFSFTGIEIDLLISMMQV